MASGGLNEAQFIFHGLKKDKWPEISVELVQSWLDDPSQLDDQVGWEEFIERFYHYYGWYWDNVNMK